MKKKTTRLMLPMLIAILLLGQPAQAHAKCAFASIRIDGRIIDDQTKSPISEAQIVGFIDGDGIVFEKDGKSGPAILKTSTDGKYAGEFLFSRYSGFFILDLCFNAPNKLEVIVAKNGYLPIKIKAKVKELKASLKQQRPAYDYEATIPEIGLWPLNPKCLTEPK